MEIENNIRTLFNLDAMNSFSTFCQGESHILIDKVCQDYALDESKKGVSIAIVCDGHGGERYFRSDVGAKFAAEVSIKQIKTLLREFGSIAKILETSDFTQVEALTTQREKGNLDKETEVDKSFRQLFKSIIACWHMAIEEHAANNPLTEQELATVPEKYTSVFLDNLEKTYGCTLMAVVATQKYWFAFHIGDGKCISFDTDGAWMEPIPWDDKCFLNKTTSLCDSDAIDEFRYCYGGRSSRPAAIFLGSDGIDDSFGETENMVNFYVQIAKMLGSGKDGRENAIQSLKEDLPKLSKIGSKDDMSVAALFDFNELQNARANLLQWQINRIDTKLSIANSQKDALIEKRERLEPVKDDSQQNTIEYNYVLTDIQRAEQSIAVLEKQLSKLKEELI